MSDPRSPSGTVLAIADDGRHAVLWDGLDRVEWLREVMLVDTCDS
jgi:hypothetical protein